MTTRLLRTLFVFAMLAAAPVVASTDPAEAEINYLLDAIGTSGCTFIRNGKEYPGGKAKDHLAMKYRRGKKYAGTAELFIKRLASESSWTGKPYQVKCPDEPTRNTGEWLTERLQAHRTKPE